MGHRQVDEHPVYSLRQQDAFTCIRLANNLICYSATNIVKIMLQQLVSALNLLTDAAGIACLSTILPSDETASSTSWQVSRRQVTVCDEKHVSGSCFMLISHI